MIPPGICTLSMEATGKQLWKMRPDEHPASTVTATPVFYQGRLWPWARLLREEALAGFELLCLLLFPR